ncbi:MAG: hypothetical protein GY953_57355, partial [bacterium]|nr:hypothetical protein [bacterium]
VSTSENTPANYEELLDETGLRDLVTTAESQGYPRTIIETDWLNFSPRVGFAWRVFGSDKTVFRGGYGIFMAGSILNNLRNNLSNQFPFAIVENFPGVNNNPELVSLQSPFPDSRHRFTGTTSVRGYDRNPQQAYLQSWNFTIERELFSGIAVEADYRGSKGTHLLRRYDINQPLRTIDAFIADEGFARPIPEWNAIWMFGTGTNSNYNAFNIALRKRSRGGMFCRVNYSFSKSIDDASQVNGASYGGFNASLDSSNLKLDRGRADWDRRHVFTAVGSYELPLGRGRRWGANWNKFVDGVVGGWQLSSTATLYSGSPFTVTLANADLNLGESPRPNRLAEGSMAADAFPGKKGADFPWFQLGAFEPVPCYIEDPEDIPAGCVESQAGFTPFAFGNSGRNILDGPGQFSVNIALSKNFNLGERKRLQFRIEPVHFMNRPHLLLTDSTRYIDTLTAGFISRVGNVGRQGGPRIFQYAIKFRF